MSIYLSEVLGEGRRLALTKGRIRLDLRHRGVDDSKLKFSYRIGVLKEHWTDRQPPEGWDPEDSNAIVPKGYDVIITGEIEP